MRASKNHDRKATSVFPDPFSGLAQVPDTAICWQCGYSLRGLTKARCPQCGRTFDANDRRTFGPRLRWQWLRRWDAAPPMWHILGVIAFTLTTIECASVAGTIFGVVDVFLKSFVAASCVSPLIVIGLAADYALRIIARQVRRSAPTDAVLPRRAPARWVATPVCLAAFVSLLVYPWPLRARFELSRPAFERWIEADARGMAPNAGPRWIGLYRVREVNEYGGATGLVFETGASLVSSVGLVHDACTCPVHRTWCRIAPNWYVQEW